MEKPFHQRGDKKQKRRGAGLNVKKSGPDLKTCWGEGEGGMWGGNHTVGGGTLEKKNTSNGRNGVVAESSRESE